MNAACKAVETANETRCMWRYKVKGFHIHWSVFAGRYLTLSNILEWPLDRDDSFLSAGRVETLCASHFVGTSFPLEVHGIATSERYNV